MDKQRTPVAACLAGALLMLVAGCSDAPSAMPASAAPPSTKRAPAPEPEVSRGPETEAGRTSELDSLPEATTFATLPAAATDPAPDERTEGVVVRVKQPLPVHIAPRGEPFAELPAEQLNNPTWVPIVAERGMWARVLLPSRPNSSTGWIRVDDPARTEKAHSRHLVEVDIDARRMVVRDGMNEIGSWTVGVGAQDTPTPRGRTFIMASIEETVSRFSPVILPLGTHSETLNSYGGGPGTVALHGWPDSAVFGTASSDGCVRVPPDALRLLTTLPLGTPVLLR